MPDGRIPPQARELEEAVLGAIMLENSALEMAMDILIPECFYTSGHQCIFRSMQALVQNNQPVDILTVADELEKRGELDLAGGAYYITGLTNHVVSTANIEAHSQIILQKFIQREVIRIGGEMVREGFREANDVFDLLDRLEADIVSVAMKHLKKDFSVLESVLAKAVKHIEELRLQGHTLTGVPSGYKDLDQCTQGWQKSDLIILAARPSVGKTAFALNLLRNAALDPMKPTPVGLFSLEMSQGQLIQRMLAAESEIHLDQIISGRLDDPGMKRLYEKGVQRLAGVPVLIDDSAGLTLFELKTKARRMKRKYNVGLIIIDYLQLMSGDTNKSENREREIARISRELKKLAKDLEIPIIALSQLSREVEKRGKGQQVPLLSDLRESGAIEQDADVVMFLYRPPEDEVREDPELRNTGMVKVAKHRNGRLDEIVLKFFGEIQKWMDLPAADAYERLSERQPKTRPSVAHSARPYPEQRSLNDGMDDFPF